MSLINTQIQPFKVNAFHAGEFIEVTIAHKRTNKKSLIDYAFHVILSNTSEKIMGQDFTALITNNYTSFKIYMTYNNIKLSDRKMLDALAAARHKQTMLMIHAENSNYIT